jgi:lipopolysaccharide biosynthesis regulator YciM
MEFEFWWLIAFPVFFGLGWLAARIDIKHLVTESRAVPRSYFRGLNFLLNEQPDKAIEAFIEVVKVDPGTVDLHFALGSLFRRRGETDRAIRMHKHLLERSDLAAEQRTQATFELGRDYLKAGLLDRAEDVFAKLREGPQRIEAARHLLEIFQQEKEWQKAIEIAQALERETGQSWQKEIAEFHCEMAAVEATHSRPDEARRLLDEAFKANRKCVRASILLGDLDAAAGRHSEAIDHWQRVETQQPAFLALVAHRLLKSFQAVGDTATGLTLLRGYLTAHPSLDLLDVVFQSTLDAEGPDAAYRLVRDELRRTPTLLGLDKLLEAQMLAVPTERRHDLELVRNLVQGQTRRLARYRCENCGFRARQFYWQCPACLAWETYPPRRTEEYDLAP